LRSRHLSGRAVVRLTVEGDQVHVAGMIVTFALSGRLAVDARDSHPRQPVGKRVIQRLQMTELTLNLSS
jgi:hypothetical protein